MKAKKETTLFTVLTGSHLYGTSGPQSDYDYKAVCLPSLEELLLNTKITNRKEKPEGISDQDKMVAGGTETEYLPLQVFFNDFFDGQTYALEVAFAAKQGLYEPAPGNIITRVYPTLLCTKLINSFLTKNVQKMVGYAVSQAKLYGLKTQRYETLKEVLATISRFTTEDGLQNTLVDLPALHEELLKLEHVKPTEIMNAYGGTAAAPAIEICSKAYPLTNRLYTLVRSLEKSLDGYGARVKEFEGEGVDWKALSHAIRITDQVIELCRTGNIAFPRPGARFLLDVKTGKLSLQEATDYLNTAFSSVDSAIAASVLQERTPSLETSFKEWKIQVLEELYELR